MRRATQEAFSLIQQDVTLGYGGVSSAFDLVASDSVSGQRAASQNRGRACLSLSEGNKSDSFNTNIENPLYR